jgi:hypothetical protein
VIGFLSTPAGLATFMLATLLAGSFIASIARTIAVHNGSTFGWVMVALGFGVNSYFAGNDLTWMRDTRYGEPIRLADANELAERIRKKMASQGYR